jgi:hypothetical protein
VRPEKIQLAKTAPDPRDGLCVLEGVVQDLAYYGGRSVYRVRLAQGQTVLVSAQNRLRSANRHLEWDESVFLFWDAASGVVDSSYNGLVSTVGTIGSQVTFQSSGDTGSLGTAINAPAPGAVALLGVAGLLNGRRRR